MRLKNWFRKEPEEKKPEAEPAPPSPEEQKRLDRIRAARRERAARTQKETPPVEAQPQTEPEQDPLQQALAVRMQHVANDNFLCEGLGKKIISAIQSEPYPPAVIVYVLEMLKTTVIQQQRAREAAAQAQKE